MLNLQFSIAFLLCLGFSFYSIEQFPAIPIDLRHFLEITPLSVT